MASWNLKVLPLVLLLALTNNVSVLSQLEFTATTPSQPAQSGKPTTFIGTVGSQIATSLLAANTPAMLWGSVPSNVITQVCNLIVTQGKHEFTANIHGVWGGSETLTLKLVATGGCGAAADSSGTQFVFTDSYQRKSAVVCPSNAGSIGCGVYMTGDDVNAIYNGATTSRHSRKLLDCQEEAGKGAITGAVTGVLGTGGCLGLGPLAPFCIVGVLGVSAQLGALGGCIAGAACFPGDAKVELVDGRTLTMEQLQVGDKVAVEVQGQKMYQPVYAFGHKDASATSEFIVIETNEHGTLELSPLHFVPIITEESGEVVYKRAQDVRTGDLVTVVSSEVLVSAPVTNVSSLVKMGLFNPLTMGGTVVVSNVVASVHSEWFLDGVFDSLGMTHLLPAAYQMVLAPVRILYSFLGHDKYVALYNWLDSSLNIAETGTRFGGSVAVVGVVLIVSVVTRKVFNL